MPDNTLHLDHQVTQALEQNPFIRGRRLRFEASEGKIVLRGVVASYFQKQMAQESLRGVEGIRHIENQLEVCWA